IYGSLEIAGECTKVFPPNVHIQNWMTYIYRKYKPGDIWYLDLWPFGPRFLVIADPEVASQFITTGVSLYKSRLGSDYLDIFLGTGSIVTAEASHWKSMRSAFNPGFSASHLMTLVPYIVDATIVFHEALADKASKREIFSLEEYATRMTIDIIGKIVLDSDFDSQKRAHPVVTMFRQRAGLMRNNGGFYPWDDFDAFRPIKLWFNARKLDGLIGKELDQLIEVRAKDPKRGVQKSFRDRKKTVIDLALDSYYQQSATEKGIAATIDPEVRREIISNMKTFIFAGHDTTATTIAYALYFLHFYPNVYQKLVQELEEVYGAGASYETISNAIKEDPHSINKLEYLTAIVKETLRLFPPASTLRAIPKDQAPLFVTDPDTGKQLPIKGFDVWVVSHMVHRNEKFFPKPDEFIPERFIPSQTPFPEAKLFTAAGKDAWRPFEKGPRNCLGQELAMIEAKVTLAIIAKDFDFVAEVDGVKCDSWTPISTVEEYRDGGKHNTVEGHRIYQILKGAAKPYAGMPGRVSWRKGVS
ncbi:cytochrome P450, partial [Rhizodiscina lignyota]